VKKGHHRPYRQEKWREQERTRGKREATPSAGAGDEVPEAPLLPLRQHDELAEPEFAEQPAALDASVK
jgi:hypothetical protein